jgi:hypothetical protein
VCFPCVDWFDPETDGREGAKDAKKRETRKTLGRWAYDDVVTHAMLQLLLVLLVLV